MITFIKEFFSKYNIMFGLHKVMTKHKGRVFEKWVFDAHSPLLSSAAIGDINNDGEPEVIFGTKEGSIHCVNKESQELWVHKTGDAIAKGDEYFYDLENLHAISNEPTLADINNDGKKEILFGSDDGTLYALSSSGELLWKYQVGGQIKSKPLVEDINNDGLPEIIVTSTAQKIVIVSNTGKGIVTYKTESPSQATPGVLRGKNGKQTIIVFGLDDGSVHAINTNEEHLWVFHTKERITAEPVFVQTTQGTIILISSWDGTLYALNTQGEQVWRFRTQGAIYNKAVVGDINRDGKKEIVFGSCDNSVYALTLEGEKLWSYQTDFWVMAHPLLFDLDNDGNTEVIVGSFDNHLYVLEGSGSYELDYVPGLSSIVHQAGHYADVLSSEPGERQGKSLWRFKTKGMIVGCSMLDKELIVNIKSGFVDSLGHKKNI